MNDFSNLYKNKSKLEGLQSERRRKLLNDQKRQRNDCSDNARGILNYIADSKERKKTNKFVNPEFKNILQKSEWMMEKPDDFDSWYLLPCPKGKRCLLVAHFGQTKVYNKSGRFMKQIKTNLPGDRSNKNDLSILDCIYNFDTGEYYALDVLAYRSQELVDCDAEFRFFWLKNKVSEDSLDIKDSYNLTIIRNLKFYECSLFEELQECFTKFPIWDNFDKNPELDGILFYHKEASYVYGTTPLVTWLFPFMIPEILGIEEIHLKYMIGRPDDFTDCKNFILTFDEKLLKRKPRQSRNIEMMDEESMDSILISEKELEMENN